MEAEETLVELFGELPYRTLVREIKDFAIFHLDTEGLILSWNEGAETIFGYSKDTIIGQDFSIIFTPEDRKQGAPEKELKYAAEIGRAEDERWHLRKDNSRFYANGVTTALRDESGKLLGYAKIARDITARKLAEETLQERGRLAAFNGDIANALIQGGDLRSVLNRCAEVLVEHLNVAFARIWTFNNSENVLELQASAGMYTHLDGEYSRIPIGKFKIGMIAKERLSHLTNDVFNDPLVSNKEWARREGMVAFAGYPLIVEEQLVGVMCAFARQPLTDLTLQAMASVSNSIANGIERKRIEEVLRESEERYRIVAETASDVIISINEQSTILFINRAAERIFGYKIEEMLGQTLTMLMPEYLRRVHEAGLGRYIETGKRHLSWEHVEVVGLHRDGYEFPLELSFGEFKRNNEHVFIGIARDISERKQAEAEREQILQREQEARRAAEETDKIKDEFLATLSHELRTPLNAILGWSNLLRSGKLDKQASIRALETVERNARSQSQLIDDLLDTSRIITGKLRLEVRPVELSNVIERAVEAVRPAADAKNIRLQMLLDTETGPISGDADRLQQVIWNLLTNAVKFTPKGGRVQARLERVNSHVEIIISDTGKGIDPEFLPYVFDRFRQADQTSTRNEGGLGLGLSIARQIVEMHGGTVRAESAGEDLGTSFIVRLPQIATVPHNEKGKEKRVHPTADGDLQFDCDPELNGLRILIADDEADSRHLLRVVLEQCGAEVTTVGSAAEALKALEDASYDVLVSDIGMPVEDGYMLINKVRSLPKEKGGRIPAIALTAYARVEDRVRALTAGFQFHVPKPVEPAELAAIVSSLAEGKGIGKF
ncbi:MAG: PAS domain S-box protein [Acidobacteria bacterium]|nr:PAS domain S-box protein [Acidobacteriota bacterium]MCA1638643.1 PAS domain S-box protein [Acidobacteriota bacterium]